MKTPNRLKGRKSLNIEIHSIVDIIHEIHRLGHTPGFQEAAKKAGASISISPQAVNFVKDYIADNDLHTKSKIASDILGACPPGTPPDNCPYSMTK